MIVVIPIFLTSCRMAFDLADDLRGQALVGLVEEEKLEVAGEGPGHGQHLLLAAREGRGLLAAPLGEAREVRIDLLERPAARLGHLGDDEILLDGQAGDDAAVLGHEADPGARRLVRPHEVQRLARQMDLALLELGIGGPGDGPEGRGLAGAVAAEQRHDLPLAHGEADALHDVALVVVGVDVAAGEEGGLGCGGHACAPPR